MSKTNIITKFNPFLDPDSVKILKLFEQIELKDSYQKDKVEEISNLILSETAKLKNRLIETELKLNTSLFADKKFLNETYSFEIPLREEYFINPENASFKNNVLTTKVSKSNNIGNIKLDINNITSRKNTDFKFIDNTLFIEKNNQYPYQELEINIPNKITTGYLYILFDKYDNISVLNSFTKEIQDKSIINSVTLPITKNDKSFILRFENNENKKINIREFYIVQNSFELNTEIITKPITINQNLKQIGINTCDNYSNENINIKYEISINNEEFKEIRPLNKHKNLELNSIISTDTYLHEYKLEKSITNTNLELFTLEELDNLDFNIIKSFKYKLGDNIGSIQGKTIFINIEEDITIYLNFNEKIVLNDKIITATDNNFPIILSKGFNKLDVSSVIWNQRIDLLNKQIISIEDNKIKYLNLITKEIITFTIPDNETSLFKQLILKANIYLDKVESKFFIKNNGLFILKEVPNNLYIFVKYNNRLVNTIQLKINMRTLNKNIPAYISNLIIRGV